MPSAPLQDVCDFVVELGLDANAYGCSASRLQVFLETVAAALGHPGVFALTPTHMLFAFKDPESGQQRIRLVAPPPPGLDLDKLARLGDVVDAVRGGTTSIAEAKAELARIRRVPVPWGRAATALAYSAIGAGIADILMGSWADITLALLLGLLVYGLVVVAGRLGPTGADWLPLGSTLVVAMIATFAKRWVPELNVVLVVLSAIAILLPGYQISTGTLDLVGGRVVSGAVNIMRGLVFLVKQAVGGWIGVLIVAGMVDIPSASASAPDTAWQWLFVPLLCVGLCVAFQTARRDFGWACLACGLAYLGILAGAAMANPDVGNLLGTVVSVLFANAWASKTGRPTSIVLVPAVVLLVSGSIGFRGLASIASGDVLLGQEQVLHMFFVALTIGVGLVIGNTISRPRITL